MSCMFLEVSAVPPIREAPGRFPSASVGSQLFSAQNNPYTILESGTEFGTPLVLLAIAADEELLALLQG